MIKSFQVYPLLSWSQAKFVITWFICCIFSTYARIHFSQSAKNSYLIKHTLYDINVAMLLYTWIKPKRGRMCTDSNLAAKAVLDGGHGFLRARLQDARRRLASQWGRSCHGSALGSRVPNKEQRFNLHVRDFRMCRQHLQHFALERRAPIIDSQDSSGSGWKLNMFIKGDG